MPSRRKTIMLLVTYRCNLHCTYCYEPKEVHKQMTVSNAKQYIHDQIAKLDINHFDEFEIQFMGGEPLMVYPLIHEVTEWLWQQTWPLKLAQVFIPTNGTLLTDEMKLWFANHNNNVCLGLSFDGDNLMQNINRSNSYSNVDLDFFAYNWPNQSVKMTISPETLPYLYQGVVFLRKKGLENIAVDLAMGSTINWQSKHLSIFANQLQLLADEHINNPQLSLISLLDMDVLNVLHHNNPIKKCSCGEQLVCIDTDGIEYACHLFAPITATHEQAIKSKEICFSKYQTFESKICNQCLLSSLCTTCYGMNYIMTGDITQQQPFTCQAFKVQFLIACNMQYQLAIKYGERERAKLIEIVINNYQ